MRLNYKSSGYFVIRYESPCGVMRAETTVQVCVWQKLRIPMRGYEKSMTSHLIFYYALRIPMRGYENRHRFLFERQN